MSATTVPAAAAFDRAAAAYDATFGSDPVACLMRSRVWERIEAHLGGTSLLLDVGCGTGLDAIHFADLGHTVVAADVSGAMLAELSRKVAAGQGGGRVRVRRLDANDGDAIDELLGAEELCGRVDVAYAGFGAINCLTDLRAFSALARDALRPGGMLVLVPMPLLSPWDLLDRRPLRRLRRKPTGDVDGARIDVRYLTLGRLCRDLGPSLRLVRCTPLGLLLPPPAPGRRARPGAARALSRLEAIASVVPGLRGIGDHLIVELRRA